VKVQIGIAVGFVVAVAIAGAAAGALAGRSPARQTTVHVTEREYTISLSRTPLPSGAVRLVVHNAGHMAHRLSISGPGLRTRTTPLIAPGHTRSLTLTLGGGSFTLWCPLGTHAALGMKTTLQLRGPVVSSPTNPNPTPPSGPGYGDGY
jgi:hypothetical protein